MSSYTPSPFSLFSFSSHDSAQGIEENENDTGMWSDPNPTSILSLISPTNSFRNSNIKSLNEFGRPSDVNKQQSKCFAHCKNYQFICVSCKKMLCNDCLKYSCIEAEQSHQTISLAVYLNKLKQQTKFMVASDLQEHNLEIYKLKVEDYLKQINEDSGQITQFAQKCINQIKQNLSKTLLFFTQKKNQMNKLFNKEVEDKCNHLKYTKAVEFILSQKNSEKDQILSVAKNWKVLSQNIDRNSKFGQVGKLNDKFTVQNVKKSINQVKQLVFRVFNKSFNELQKSLTQLSSLDQSLNSEFSQPKSPKKCASNKKLLQTPSRLSLSIKENENKTPPHISLKKQRQYLNSITNMLNKQINKAPTPMKEERAKRNIHTTIKKSNRKQNKQNQIQISTIRIYGGKGAEQICCRYNPHIKVSKNEENFTKSQNQLKNKKSLNSTFHVGFGALRGRVLGLAQNFSQAIVVAGGYLNNEISDCIFRVDFKRNKRELISRLGQPMAYFGVDSQLITSKNGQNKIIAYFCGGINEHGFPLSSLFSYEFSPVYSVISNQQLPSMQQPRHSLSLTLHHSNLYAVGGVDHQKRAVETVTKFNLENRKWSKIGNLCYERANHQTISLRSGMYVVGGFNGQNWLKSVERLDEMKGVFNVVMELKEGRESFGIFPYIQDNSFLVLGGKNYTQLASCEYVSIKDKTSEYTAELQSPKYNIFCF